MVAFHLDPVHQKRLDEIARVQGQNVAAIARQVLVDYLDFQALPEESDEAWAEASVALAPEIFAAEDWNENGHESK